MNKGFEGYLKELEEVVAKLESKDISLDDACEAYKKGIELSKKCHEIFKQTEQLVVKQVTDSGVTDFNIE